jgi:serine/threonine protein phosphatase 1
MLDRDKFARLKTKRIWAIASVHGDVNRLTQLHDLLTTRIGPRDGVVYLGNYLGVGHGARATVDELVDFRRWLLSRPYSFAADVVYLRGAQEEMWSKLLQLQFAPNPSEVLRWLLDHGVAATLESYGGNPDQGFMAAREGAVATTRWTSALRDRIASCPGHTPFLSGLRRAAVNETETLLFVHAGIDVSRPLDGQSDNFWWASAAFERIDQPYNGFRSIVRGFDPGHSGLIQTPYTLSVDGGAGLGGSLIAVCLGPDGAIEDRLEV